MAEPGGGVPGAPLETFAAMDAVGPSLMPRTSRLQGVSMGLSVLGARATTRAAERLTGLVLPDEAPLARQLATRAAVGAGGTALALLPERDGERLWMASVRTAGRLLRAGAVGGAVHDLGVAVQERYPSQRRPGRWRSARRSPVGCCSGGAADAGQRGAVQRWPLPQTTTLPATLATSYAVTAVGTGLTRRLCVVPGALESYFGPGPSKRLLARLVNAGIWTAGATALYNTGVAYVGRANEKVEPACATRRPPPGVGERRQPAAVRRPRPAGTPVCDRRGHPGADQGVMGEEALAHPIRAYVGFNSEPLYPTGRAELALAELDRVGAFDGRICCWSRPPAPAGSTTP